MTEQEIAAICQGFVIGQIFCCIEFVFLAWLLRRRIRKSRDYDTPIGYVYKRGQPGEMEFHPRDITIVRKWGTEQIHHSPDWPTN